MLFLLFAFTTIFVVNEVLLFFTQETFIFLELLLSFVMLWQFSVCTDTPFEFVIYPTISSPGIGLQHFANCTLQFGIFSTITKSEFDFDLNEETLDIPSFFTSILSFLYASFNLFITFNGDTLPNPIFS